METNTAEKIKFTQEMKEAVIRKICTMSNKELAGHIDYIITMVTSKTVKEPRLTLMKEEGEVCAKVLLRRTKT
jgi:hypothetical protein